MESRLFALARFFIYGLLSILILGSAGLLFSPAWVREAVFTLHLSPGVQPTAIRFETANSPTDEISRVKSYWPSHFNKSLYDMPDDELPENLDGSQLIAILDFPKEGWWSASSLHQLKERIHLKPDVSGEWYVSGMGQKLVFIPKRAQDSKIWESGKSYQVILDQALHARSQRHWMSFDPFTLAFTVPSCLVHISHQVQAYSLAPLRYQVIFNIESNFPLSLQKVKQSASLMSSLRSTKLVGTVNASASTHVTGFLAESVLGASESLKLQLKSDPIEPLTVDELLANLPSGDYMSGVICSSPLISDRVPASELTHEIKLTSASVSLERAAGEFWPQYVLHLDFSQPVAASDVKAHLHLNSPTALQVEALNKTDGFARSHALVINTAEYDPVPIAIEFSDGNWSETGIQPANALRWDEPLQLPTVDSLCPDSLKPIFQFDNSKGLTAAQVLACGDPDASPYVVTGLQVWKFINKKESPAIRVIGLADDGETVVNSIVCFDKTKDRIAITQADDKEVASLSSTLAATSPPAAVVKPFTNWQPRPGFVCDRLKSDCLAQSIDLSQFCDAPVSDHP